MRVLVFVLVVLFVDFGPATPSAWAFGRIFHHKKSPKPGPLPTPKPTTPPIPPGRYPGLPQSCQSLSTRSHGACQTVGLELPSGPGFSFQSDLQDAINSVSHDPTVFDGDTIRAGKESAYAKQLSSFLNGRGICAVWEYDNVMYFRRGAQDYCEEVEFIHTRTRRPNIFGRVQCGPADQIPTTGPNYSCVFDNSVCNPTGDPSLSAFDDDLRAIVRQIIVEEKAKGASSAIIDFNYDSHYVESGETVGYLLKDDGYPFVDAVAKKALARGYCISTDRWKGVSMKKGDLFTTHSVTHAAAAPDPRVDPTILTKPAKMGLLNACKAYQVRKVDESNPDDWYNCTYILDKWEDRCSAK